LSKGHVSGIPETSAKVVDTHRAELVRLFRRVGYVSDTTHTLNGNLVIFRGDLGGNGKPRGISWTRSLRVARWFADYCVPAYLPPEWQFPPT
jgi:hypothetical protein